VFSFQFGILVSVQRDSIRVQLMRLARGVSFLPAGQEKFRSLTSAYYRGTQGIVLTYDVTNRASFDSIENWLNEAQLNGTYGKRVNMPADD
jgi:hypothetical protein